jgi:hypothetical protein
MAMPIRIHFVSVMRRRKPHIMDSPGMPLTRRVNEDARGFARSVVRASRAFVAHARRERASLAVLN